MRSNTDWSWKLSETVERIKTRYEHIGRKTGAPFLAVVYPPEVESVVLKEWQILSSTLDNNFTIKTVDVLAVTMEVMKELGTENIVNSMTDSMPGSNPEAELGHLWIRAVVSAVKESSAKTKETKIVVCLTQLAALYPAAGPRAVMQELWDGGQISLDGPVIAFIPGTLVDRRVYSFVNQREEFMYRGDII